MSFEPEVSIAATGIVADATSDRDDRTRRAVALLVGETRADFVLTHFATQTVDVCVDTETLYMPNGLLAAIAALNMIARFAGTVRLSVLGAPDPPLADSLYRAIDELRGIDTRARRSIEFEVVAFGETRRSSSVESSARLWIGAPPTVGCSARLDPMIDIHVAYDAWRCHLSRGAAAGTSVSSTIPFGALAGSCFGAAEVFKTLIAGAVDSGESAAVRSRLTNSWSFDTWTMERCVPGTALSSGARLNVPATLPIDGVLQIGAGAVGNAAALAFASFPAASGCLRVLDTKSIDWKNLNRCYYFIEKHVGSLKVAILERCASRAGLTLRGQDLVFSADVLQRGDILLSTVDNNEARHRMQEALPHTLVQGSTGGTTVAVSVHSPGNGRSCLVCRHPDPSIGTTRRRPLSLQATAALTGLNEDEIAIGRVEGSMAITEAVVARVAQRSAESAEMLRAAMLAGQDLCGGIGDLRTTLGTTTGPREATVPFVSNLAGILAAAEIVKLLMRAAGAREVALLDNVLQIDLARDYSRHDRLSFREPQRLDCPLCRGRAREIAEVIADRRGRVAS